MTHTISTPGLTRRRGVAVRAVGAALALVLLAGCSALAGDVTRDVHTSVLAADPNIVDTRISVGQDLTGPGVRLRIYLTDTTDAAVVSSLEAALEAAHLGAPTPLTGIFLDASAAPRPRSSSTGGGSLSLRSLKDSLDLPGSISDDVIHVGRDDLVEFYGPRSS
ncbi:hypothetical protein [Salinibacterium sp. ZJ70]|uniref:hypothetical protein n=1 Tax=Salinibacterium sp. ZJ70 TaxID=2708084 RepID=UPI001422107C|nr:hypothetical protein [Salinibacterium sp. ZJ70]